MGHLQSGTLSGTTQGAGFKSDLTWEMWGIFWSLIFQNDLQVILLVQTCLTPGAIPALPTTVVVVDNTVRQSSHGPRPSLSCPSPPHSDGPGSAGHDPPSPAPLLHPERPDLLKNFTLLS